MCKAFNNNQNFNAYNPLVSIVVPVFNVEDYIEESIKSICNQTYKPIEIIVVDDESKDSSILTAKKVLEEYRVNYKIIHQMNKGLPGARNTGLLESNGQYVCFIDSDDILAEDHIKNAVISLNKKEKACYSDFELTNDKNREGKKTFFEGQDFLDQEELFRLFSERRIKIHCCSILADRLFLIDNQIFFNEKLRYGEDVDFMWRLFSKTKGIVHVRQNSYKYLQRKNSIMTTAALDKWFIFIDEFHETISNLKQTYPEYIEVYSYVYYRTLLGLMNTAARNCYIEEYLMLCKKINTNKMKYYLSKSVDVRTRVAAFLIKYDKCYYYLIHAIKVL